MPILPFAIMLVPMSFVFDAERICPNKITMPNPLQELHYFGVNQIIDIDNIAEFINCRIDRISDSGVTIFNSHYPNGVVVSCKSPARLSDSQVIEVGKPGRKRGIAAEVTLPEGDLPFTIKQLSELNSDLAITQITTFIKENCLIAGEAGRVIGQRGKTAKTYKLIT